MEIDGGKPFDWGKTSRDYARYRDIYPPEFYQKILERGLCQKGQTVLDLGTGTGVLPRNLYRYGANWTGVDISPEQIEEARRLSEGMDIRYLVSPAESLDFPAFSFDVVSACQCFWYFDHSVLMPKLAGILKPGGSLLILYMSWLPFEDPIAGESEKLVLKYSPRWSGGGEWVHPIQIPDCYLEKFTPVYHEEFRVRLHFTRESWNGRMKACRGVEASLSPEETARWEREHKELLLRIAPPEFDILHYYALAQLEKI